MKVKKPVSKIHANTKNHAAGYPDASSTLLNLSYIE